MFNDEIENLKKCNATIIPSDYGLNCEVEINLIVMLEGNNAKNANFSISVNNGKSTTSPITNKDLNYKTINNNTIDSIA